MDARIVAAAFVLCGLPVPVGASEMPVASDLSQPSLPTFAQTAAPSDPSPWTGLYVGSEVFAISGGKGVRGGFGGGGYAGYDRELDNGIVVGVQGKAGYIPGFFKHSAVKGFNYAATEVRVGYDLGQFMPFVTAGVGFAKPNLRSFGGYTGVTNSANDLFNSRGDLRSFQTVGAGFAYKFNDKLSVELAVQAYHGNGFIGP